MDCLTMSATDLYAISLLEAALVLFTAYAVVIDARNRVRERTAEASATVTRGNKSMAALYTVYSASVAACLVLINNASSVEGHKVALIVVDYLCITYLFFFSSWFRNAVFFPLADRVRKD